MTPSIIVILEEGGNWSFIDGTRAMYPSTTVAIDPIRLYRSFYWKNIVRLRSAKRKIGINIVAREFTGYL
jgi:hypothetical protein